MSGQDTSTSVEESYTDKVYKESKLDKKPEFPGGINELNKYVMYNFRIPEIGKSGNYDIKVSFVIETDGTMTNFEVVKDPGFEMGKEAIKVLSSVKKKWSPGIKKKEAVRSLFILPIYINIKD